MKNDTHDSCSCIIQRVIKPALHLKLFMSRDGQVLICYELQFVIMILLYATHWSDVSMFFVLKLLLCSPGNKVLLLRLYSTNGFQYNVLYG